MVTLWDIKTSKNIDISSLELTETNYYGPRGREDELKKFLDDQIYDNSDKINDNKIIVLRTTEKIRILIFQQSAVAAV